MGISVEPSFELPAELVEYKGDPDDKKAILQFRQLQQVRVPGGTCMTAGLVHDTWPVVPGEGGQGSS